MDIKSLSRRSHPEGYRPRLKHASRLDKRKKQHTEPDSSMLTSSIKERGKQGELVLTLLLSKSQPQKGKVSQIYNRRYTRMET